MHYYKRNLGDYAKKAGRLSMLQHGAYTLLIDTCYDREEFPTIDAAYEWTWASTKEEREAVEFVLQRFFTLENGIYVQKRIQEEIEAYHGKAKINSRIAQERETKRKENNTNRAQDVNTPSPLSHEPSPNQEPITNNQQPKEKTPISPFRDVDEQFKNFYARYPRKVARATALKAWIRAGPTPEIVKKIMQALELHIEIEWKNRTMDKIPHPATWLNNARWEDEITKADLYDDSVSSLIADSIRVA